MDGKTIKFVSLGADMCQQESANKREKQEAKIFL